MAMLVRVELSAMKPVSGSTSKSWMPCHQLPAVRYCLPSSSMKRLASIAFQSEALVVATTRPLCVHVPFSPVGLSARKMPEFCEPKLEAEK